MAISSLSAISADTTNPLLSKLEANGLSADKAQLVENDLANAFADTASGSTSGTVDVKSVRAALDQKIDEDVASGKLSASDATAVKKTLDDLDAQSSGTSTQSSTAATTTATASDSSASTSSAQSSGSGSGSGGAGGAGGGGSSTKTELSETVTVSGGIKTTVITYTDGTTSTTTTAATDQDQQKYGSKQAEQAAASTASKYLSTIQPGSLFQVMA
ncbi:hypothetical protein [Novosphingobium terrae]|uniref:hypothetical protein n=1 Tax=Novosphingobium terrae TaxID=2726189 RepID=UPI00197F7501|nr:hypothetical protein [Novosphingobium terrae]